MKRVFRKELLYKDEELGGRSACVVDWAEETDGKEVHPCKWVPGAYETDGYVFHEDWCEEVEDDE